MGCKGRETGNVWPHPAIQVPECNTAYFLFTPPRDAVFTQKEKLMFNEKLLETFMLEEPTRLSFLSSQQELNLASLMSKRKKKLINRRRVAASFDPL